MNSQIEEIFQPSRNLTLDELDKINLEFFRKEGLDGRRYLDYVRPSSQIDIDSMNYWLFKGVIEIMTTDEDYPLIEEDEEGRIEYPGEILGLVFRLTEEGRKYVKSFKTKAF